MKKKELRQKKVKFRKNFLPTLVLIILLWSIAAFIIYFVDPSAFGILPALLLVIFFALLFTASLLFANTRRGLIIASFLTLFIILRYLGVGNIINFLLILGVGITLELYFSKT